MDWPQTFIQIILSLHLIHLPIGLLSVTVKVYIHYNMCWLLSLLLCTGLILLTDFLVDENDSSLFTNHVMQRKLLIVEKLHLI